MIKISLHFNSPIVLIIITMGVCVKEILTGRILQQTKKVSLKTSISITKGISLHTLMDDTSIM